MGRTITYPDGSQMTSTAQSQDQIQTALQIATAIMLGYTVTPFPVQFTLTTGSNVAACNTLFLYAGQTVVAPGLPANTLIMAVGPGNFVSFTTLAIQTGVQTGTVSDPNTPSYVRIGWQIQGQPGPLISNDTCFVRASSIDSEYTRLHDQVQIPATGTTATTRDVYTRRWKVWWTFYGPNSVDQARIVQTGLIGVPYVESILNASNLYVDPSIEEPQGMPENYQGQWWDRADLVAEMNEQITETVSVGTVGSVEVQVFDHTGLILDVTVT